MNREEIFNQRREIAQRLLRPLRMDGHLGAARDFSTRPYADGEKKYRFSMANYLRLAASEHFHSGLRDPRWYTFTNKQNRVGGWPLFDQPPTRCLTLSDVSYMPFSLSPY